MNQVYQVWNPPSILSLDSLWTEGFSYYSPQGRKELDSTEVDLVHRVWKPLLHIVNNWGRIN